MNAAGQGGPTPGYGPCKKHGGFLPGPRKAASQAQAVEQMVAWGLSREIDPSDALLECVYRTAALASYFRARVAQLQEDQLTDDGTLTIWLKLEREEVERLARFAKMALDAGVAERRVRVAERTGALIAQAIEESLAELDLPAAQRARFAAAVAIKLSVLEATSDQPVLVERNP